jgi:predicted permease
MVNRLPLAGVGQVNPMAFQGTETVTSPLSTDTRTVTPDYFRTMRIPLIEGRSFTSHDNEAAAPVAIIDDRIARALWPGQSALGHRVRFPFGNLPWSEIVGVVGHIRHDGLDTDPRPQVYFNYLQRAQDRMALVVRGGGSVGALAPSVLQAIREIDRDQPVYDVRMMPDVIQRSTAQQWLSRTLVTTFALIALLLAAVGLYGLISYGVTTQAREFGVRLALGATRTGIARLVLGRAALLAVSGIGFGLIVAFLVTRTMRSLLFGVGAGDPFSFGIAVATLVAVALVASYIPARRAASVDPAVTLRAD